MDKQVTHCLSSMGKAVRIPWLDLVQLLFSTGGSQRLYTFPQAYLLSKRVLVSNPARSIWCTKALSFRVLGSKENKCKPAIKSF